MPNKLKGLKITSTDLVTEGANPDAHIRLFKRRDATDSEPGDSLVQKIAATIANSLAGVFGKTTLTESSVPVAKEAKTFDEEMNRERLRDLTSEAWNYTYALSDSLSSIICDVELSEDSKKSLMNTSLDEFAATLRNAIPNWARGDLVESDGAAMKSKAQQAAFDKHWEGITKTMGGDPEQGEPTGESTGNDNNVEKSQNTNQKEETENMKFDKSKMTPEEQATLAEFEKKYGVAEPEGSPASTADGGGVTKGAEPPKGNAEGASATPELHPEVKKALDDNKALAAQIEDLKKSLEIKDLTAIAKKYEIIGKKAEELAVKLYTLKKAGNTAYEDTIALLDEQVMLVEKSGLFGEMGRNTSGGTGVGAELDAKAAEIRKSNAGMTTAEAFAKAYEQYPELAAQYEQTYKGRV